MQEQILCRRLHLVIKEHDLRAQEPLSKFPVVALMQKAGNRIISEIAEQNDEKEVIKLGANLDGNGGQAVFFNRDPSNRVTNAATQIESEEGDNRFLTVMEAKRNGENNLVIIRNDPSGQNLPGLRVTNKAGYTIVESWFFKAIPTEEYIMYSPDPDPISADTYSEKDDSILQIMGEWEQIATQALQQYLKV